MCSSSGADVVLRALQPIPLVELEQQLVGERAGAVGEQPLPRDRGVEPAPLGDPARVERLVAKRLEHAQLRPDHHDAGQRVGDLGVEQRPGSEVEPSDEPLDRALRDRTQAHVRNLTAVASFASGGPGGALGRTSVRSRGGPSTAVDHRPSGHARSTETARHKEVPSEGLQEAQASGERASRGSRDC